MTTSSGARDSTLKRDALRFFQKKKTKSLREDVRQASIINVSAARTMRVVFNVQRTAATPSPLGMTECASFAIQETIRHAFLTRLPSQHRDTARLDVILE